MMRKTAIILVLIGLSACVGPARDGLPPNAVTKNQSSFDGATELVMEPGHVYEAADRWAGFKLGLVWRSTVSDVVVVKAEIPATIAIIAGLEFSIDGERVSLSPEDVFTDFDRHYYGGYSVGTSSVQRFVIPLELLRQVVKAKSAKVRLNLRDSYMEGDLKVISEAAAIHGFRDFLATLQN